MSETIGYNEGEGERAMSDVFDYAKFFMKHDPDTNRNTFDGNMKLQKLLVLADLVSLAERDIPLFEDEILAFEHGCVIEKVRLRHANDFAGFIADSREFNPDFTQEEYNVLNLTVALFGGLSARDLSDINHAFSFWLTSYNNSIQPDGFKNKNKAVVSIDAMRGELDRIRDAIAAFRETESENQFKETINGVDFYYTPNDPVLTEEILTQLYNFSRFADEKAYSVYLDNGSLVIC